MSDSQRVARKKTRRTESPQRLSRILIVDDHPVLREGLADLLRREADFEVCAEAGDAQEALSALRDHQPDLAVVDLLLPDLSGIELIERIKAEAPDTLIVVLSIREERVFADQALRAGATGYVMKQSASRTLVEAVRTARRGEVYLSSKLSEWMLSQAHRASHKASDDAKTNEITTPVERLTAREMDVFRGIGNGRRAGQIAEDLGLSVKTVDSYREIIKDKLGFADGVELSHYAVQWVTAHQDS